MYIYNLMCEETKQLHYENVLLRVRCFTTLALHDMIFVSEAISGKCQTAFIISYFSLNSMFSYAESIYQLRLFFLRVSQVCFLAM